MGTMGNNAEDKKAVQVGCGGKGKPGPWSVSEQQVLPLEGGRVEGKPGSQPPSPGTQAAGGSSLHHFCRWPQYSRSAWWRRAPWWLATSPTGPGATFSAWSWPTLRWPRLIWTFSSMSWKGWARISDPPLSGCWPWHPTSPSLSPCTLPVMARTALLGNKVFLTMFICFNPLILLLNIW